ncbi:ComEC/Rec2 family competence protein [Campylobacter majalis]|uniref:ComEC/Rec2 family competence protein n=1 Tax=Campylobacter majalis TaxID=2790656 RepID=UPI003D694B72
MVLLVIFSANIYLKWREYQDFLELNEHEIVAKIQRDYFKINKNGNKYRVLLLDAKKYSFYTVATKNTKISDYVRVEIFTLDVTFASYLKGRFYMPTSKISSINLAKNTKDKAINFIASQHQNSKISEFYTALYFAEPISSEFRSEITKWGASHLIAISGYHLGLILSVFYLFLMPAFKMIYARFCPWRNFKIDIFCISLLFLSGYFWILGVVPSFFRAFVLVLIGFYFAYKNIKILNFETLFIVVAICICVYPSLILNIGFYLSVVGVFYIYLYLHHFRDVCGKMAHIFCLNIYMFFVMQVCVLYFFPLISFQQFGVLGLNFVFLLFYPISVLLHIFGYGWLMDEILLKFLATDLNHVNAEISTFEFIVYNILSIFAIRSKFLSITILFIGILTFLFLL